MTLYVLFEDLSKYKGVFKSLTTIRDYIERGGGHIIDEDTAHKTTYFIVQYPADDITATFRAKEAILRE